jgi:hypothetical protein
MGQKIRKATLLIRLWTDEDPAGDNAWHGSADHIGSGKSFHFQTLDEFVAWMRQQLKEVNKP